MASMNLVVVCGNLTAEPELKFIPSGAAVCNLRMATNRRWKAADGTWKDEATYLSVVTWNKSAEACGEFLHKGAPVLVEGRLQSRQWETDKGEKRSILEIHADRVQFLSKPEPKAAEPAIEF